MRFLEAQLILNIRSTIFEICIYNIIVADINRLCMQNSINLILFIFIFASSINHGYEQRETGNYTYLQRKREY